MKTEGFSQVLQAETLPAGILPGDPPLNADRFLPVGRLICIRQAKDGQLLAAHERQCPAGHDPDAAGTGILDPAKVPV